MRCGPGRNCRGSCAPRGGRWSGKERNQRETAQRDRHHARKDGRADPDESLDQAEYLLLQLDREQLDAILPRREGAICQSAHPVRLGSGSNAFAGWKVIMKLVPIPARLRMQPDIIKQTLLESHARDGGINHLVFSCILAGYLPANAACGCQLCSRSACRIHC
jgi:hypothetical protein